MKRKNEMIIYWYYHWCTSMHVRDKSCEGVFRMMFHTALYLHIEIFPSVIAFFCPPSIRTDLISRAKRDSGSLRCANGVGVGAKRDRKASLFWSVLSSAVRRSIAYEPRRLPRRTTMQNNRIVENTPVRATGIYRTYVLPPCTHTVEPRVGSSLDDQSSNNQDALFILLWEKSIRLKQISFGSDYNTHLNKTYVYFIYILFPKNKRISSIKKSYVSGKLVEQFFVFNKIEEQNPSYSAPVTRLIFLFTFSCNQEGFAILSNFFETNAKWTLLAITKFTLYEK